MCTARVDLAIPRRFVANLMGYVADVSKSLASFIRVEVICKRVAVSSEMFGTHAFITWRKNPEMTSEFSAVFFWF
jgi:hypothetical protein